MISHFHFLVNLALFSHLAWHECYNECHSMDKQQALYRNEKFHRNNCVRHIAILVLTLWEREPILFTLETAFYSIFLLNVHWIIFILEFSMDTQKWWHSGKSVELLFFFSNNKKRIPIFMPIGAFWNFPWRNFKRL